MRKVEIPMTTRDEIAGWLARGQEEGATHMIVVCDTFDYDDYPVFVSTEEDVEKRVEYYRGASMQRVMEVYDLRKPLGPQLMEERAYNL